VFILLIDRDACNVLDVALFIARTLHRWYPNQFPLEKIGHLLLHEENDGRAQGPTRSLPEIRALWRKDLEEFQKRRENYLIYK